VRLSEAGKLPIDGLVTRRYRLEQINEAIDDLRTGSVAGRSVVWMEDR
jgi:Zn-dependent alcohol dehydrogenase